jgi:hypothetical protein
VVGLCQIKGLTLCWWSRLTTSVKETNLPSIDVYHLGTTQTCFSCSFSVVQGGACIVAYLHRVRYRRLSVTIRPTKARSPPAVIISTSAPVHTFVEYAARMEFVKEAAKSI